MRRTSFLEDPGAILPKATIVALKLTPVDLQGVPTKLASEYSGTWVLLECSENGTTYRSRVWCAKFHRVSYLKVLELSDEPGTRPE